MKIGGIQKLTLLDFPGKIASTLFTVGCNFRCPFCHNASLVTHTENAGSVSEEEALAYLSKRKGIIEGVCLTGGEPTIWSDVSDFLENVKNIGLSVKLDTNGSSPEKLAELMDRGLLDYVAMDIKNSPEKYALTSGSESALESAKKSVRLLMEGNVPFEFRTTVVKGLHTPGDIEEIARWIAGAKRYYLQGFRDSGDLINGSGLAAFSPEEMNELLISARKYLPITEIRGE